MQKFRSTQGWNIVVENGIIRINNKELYRFEDDAIYYNSKRNRLIEDGGSTFLFVEVDGSPNLNELYAFQLTGNSVKLLAKAISSDLKDLDADSYLEFGGTDLTEMHPSPDSMYYIPYDYYEIREGRILYDSALSKKKDIQVNGVYLANPYDSDMNCCKVIVKPGLKKIPLVDPLIVSERIDGPANVRDMVRGKPLFVLNDNTPVSTGDTVGGWYRIGIKVDLADAQLAAGKIAKGATLFVSGLAVGTALDDLRPGDVYAEKGKRKGKGVVMGYTSTQNIRAMTLPENMLAMMIDQPSMENIGITRLKDFIKGYGFSQGRIGSYEVFQLDEGVAYGPASPLRLALVFNKDELFGVVHKRRFSTSQSWDYNLNGGYCLTVITSPSHAYTGEFIKQFNAWVGKAN